MRTTAPYLRQHSDSYWEIVSDNPSTGRPKRTSTRTKNREEAEVNRSGFAGG
jgi:hypothetical protein